MKKLLAVLVGTLAINFIVIAGAVGWLYKTGKLDRDKVMAIKEIVFPPPAPPEEEKPEEDETATTQPVLKLEELLAKHSGRTAGEQVEFIQRAFDAQMAQLDRRHRELAALQDQIDTAKTKLAADRAVLDEDRKKLTAEEQQAETLANDQGFQDSLELYKAMPPKQVKTIFMTLADDQVVRYLQAMEPRGASRIIKEFKAPEEVERVQRVLEMMRLAQASSSTMTTPTAATTNGE